MAIDTFYIFSMLPAVKQELIKPYISPANEHSIFKNIPLDKLEEFKQYARVLSGKPIRVKYRGPRYDLTKATVLKADARCAAIYPL